MAKAGDIRQLSVNDLKARVKDLSEEVFRTGMQRTMGTTKDKHIVVKKRRELAKILTVLNEKVQRS